MDIDMTTTAQITVNQQPARWEPGLSLAALLAAHGHAPHAVATAVNGRFVPRHAREGQLLQPGDAVLLFQPITGG